MTNRARPSRIGRRRAAVTETAIHVGAAEFKTHCLELLNRVAVAGADYVVTRHGKPLARVAPFRPKGAASLFGALKGTVLAYDRPFDPVDGEWDSDRP